MAAGAPQSELAKAADDLLHKGADQAIKSGLGGWWEQRTDAEKAATTLIAIALAIGPLGQGLLAVLGVLFNGVSIPTSKQVEAVFWLFFITAPLAAFVLVVVSMAGKHAAVPVSLGLAGIVSVAIAGGMIGTPAPKSLAGVYCYADISGGVPVYERQCREFNNAGFYAENAPRAGSPSQSADVFSSAVAYTVDARGLLMALASILAATGVGIIIREQT